MALPTSGTLGANLIMAEFGFPASTTWRMSTDGAAWISFTVGSQIAQSDFYGASAGPALPFSWNSIGNSTFQAYQYTEGITQGVRPYTPDNNTGSGVTQPSASQASRIYNVLYLANASTWQQETGFDWASAPTAKLVNAQAWSHHNWRWNQFPDPNKAMAVPVRGAIVYSLGSTSVFWSGWPNGSSLSRGGTSAGSGNQGGLETPGWAMVNVFPFVGPGNVDFPTSNANPNLAFRGGRWNTPWSAQSVPGNGGGVPGGSLVIFDATASSTRRSFGSSYEIFIEFQFDA